MGNWLIDQGLADQQALDQIEVEAKEEIKTSAEFAIDAPYPDQSEVDEHVYAA